MLIEADYSQIELRGLAAFSQDETLKGIYKDGRDLHSETARSALNIPLHEAVPKEDRTFAKGVNFGVIYGETAWGLARQLNKPVDEAERFIENFFTMFPQAREWIERVQAFARKHGRVYTMFGRWRTLENARIKPHTEEETRLYEEAMRQASNAPIQGTASDICQVSAIELEKQFALLPPTIEASLVSTVHDSLLVECRQGKESVVIRLMREVMTTAPLVWIADQWGDVPIVVDFKVGTTWGDAVEV